MFIQRLITSLILVPLVLLIIFYGNPWVLLGIVLMVTFLAGREFWQLIPVNELQTKVGFLILLFLGVWGCGFLFPVWQVVGLVTWLLVCGAIVSYPGSQSYWGFPPVVALSSLLLFPLFIQSLMHLYAMPQGKGLLVYLLFLIWSADVGAYLVGKLYGSHKLIPQVSPGKSWEGVTGGFVLSLVVATAGCFYFVPYATALWFLLAVMTVIISIFGDLFISILKRRCHLKDTGAIIPGHGGVLDRLDSLIAAMPVFYIGLTYIPFGV